MEIIGFDPFTAPKGMTMSGNGEEENGLIVLKHAADTKKVSRSSSWMRSTGRPNTRSARFTASARWRAWLHQFCEQIDGGHRPQSRAGADGINLVNEGHSQELPGPIGEISKAKAPFMMGYADLDGLEDVIEDPTVNDMAREAMMIVSESGDDLVMSAQVVAQSVETAEHKTWPA